ncbi:hypothetical protein [Aquimarina agarivorans]|uniref:hypothetical protein n=1 Tax=Aquimarina agarivorans TaxID=980584 RepID=UPI000248E80B|nr:hypothetical protein [Aquimarina agarivorans]
MNSISVNYIAQELQNQDQQQAAGFPPFTRGYKTHQFVTTLKVALTTSQTIHFELAEFSINNLVILFKQIKTNIQTLDQASKVNLRIPITTATNTTIYTRVLRFLLAYICHDLFDNPSYLKFNFIAFAENIPSVASIYYLANMAQIDFIIVDPIMLNRFKKIRNLLSSTPIDCLSGSHTIERDTASLISEICPKISIS